MARRLTITQKRWLLSAHILLSVAWFGTALCFLVLSLVAVGTRDESMLRAAYVSVDTLDRILVRPLAIGTAATGILLSSLTQWGLFRFYWVMAKESATVALIGSGVIVLNRATATIVSITSTAGLRALQDPTYQSNQNALLAYIVLEIVLLSASVVLSVFKPSGQRAALSERYARQTPSGDRSPKTFGTQE